MIHGPLLSKKDIRKNRIARPREAPKSRSHNFAFKYSYQLLCRLWSPGAELLVGSAKGFVMYPKGSKNLALARARTSYSKALGSSKLNYLAPNLRPEYGPLVWNACNPFSLIFKTPNPLILSNMWDIYL